MASSAREKTRVLVYIKNLNGGGAERVMIDLVDAMNRDGYEARLLLGEYAGEYLDSVDPALLIPPQGEVRNGRGRSSLVGRVRNGIRKRVRRIVAERATRRISLPISDPKDLRAARWILTDLARSNLLRRLRAALGTFRPHAVISNLLESASLPVFVERHTRIRRGHDYGWIAVEHNNTVVRLGARKESDHVSMWRQLTTAVYNAADAVVAVSDGVGGGLVANYEIDPATVVVIHNGVNVAAISSVPPLERERPYFLAVGRLHPQKNFGALIEAYARIADRVEEDLVILGEGEERPELEAAAHAAGVADRVELAGFRDNVWSYMKSATCLAMSSRYEGLPMTLLEAMAAGCPIVSFDCDYGPREVVSHGESGFLVPNGDTAALANALYEVAANPSLARRFGVRARELVERFDRVLMAEKYGELVDRVVAVAERRNH